MMNLNYKTKEYIICEGIYFLFLRLFSCVLFLIYSLLWADLGFMLLLVYV